MARTVAALGEVHYLSDIPSFDRWAERHKRKRSRRLRRWAERHKRKRSRRLRRMLLRRMQRRYGKRWWFKAAQRRARERRAVTAMKDGGLFKLSSDVLTTSRGEARRDYRLNGRPTLRPGPSRSAPSSHNATAFLGSLQAGHEDAVRAAAARGSQLAKAELARIEAAKKMAGATTAPNKPKARPQESSAVKPVGSRSSTGTRPRPKPEPAEGSTKEQTPSPPPVKVGARKEHYMASNAGRTIPIAMKFEFEREVLLAADREAWFKDMSQAFWETGKLVEDLVRQYLGRLPDRISKGLASGTQEGMTALARVWEQARKDYAAYLEELEKEYARDMAVDGKVRVR